MILRERVVELGRAVLTRISGDPRSVRVLAPAEFSPHLCAFTPPSP